MYVEAKKKNLKKKKKIKSQWSGSIESNGWVCLNTPSPIFILKWFFWTLIGEPMGPTFFFVSRVPLSVFLSLGSSRSRSHSLSPKALQLSLSRSSLSRNPLFLSLSPWPRVHIHSLTPSESPSALHPPSSFRPWELDGPGDKAPINSFHNFQQVSLGSLPLCVNVTFGSDFWVDSVHPYLGFTSELRWGEHTHFSDETVVVKGFPITSGHFSAI